MIEAVLVLALFLFIVWRERQWARERADLLQRIQAPARAVAAHEREEEVSGPVPVIGLDDDEAMKKLRERREFDDAA